MRLRGRRGLWAVKNSAAGVEDVGAEGEGACEDVFGDEGRTRARWCVWGYVCKREKATGIGVLAGGARRLLCQEGVNCAVRRVDGRERP